MTFRVGQKVVCINDEARAFQISTPSHIIVEWDKMDGLTKGIIYTIREVYFDSDYKMYMVRLVEIVRPLLDGEIYEAGYGMSRFRPVVELKDDIAMFKALLAPTPDLVVMPDLEPSHSGL